MTQKVKHKVNPNFKNYSRAFKNLTTQTKIMTEHPVISMIISYDSKRVIIVTKINDAHFEVSQYNLACLSFHKTFNEIYGATPDSYIKIKDIEQNQKGD